MQSSLKTCFATALLSTAVVSVNVQAVEDQDWETIEDDHTNTCSDEGWTHSGPITWLKAGSTLENTIITCEPNTDYCLKVNSDNLTLRNVIVYHPANGMGIFGWKPQNLTMENVQVIAYGNEWGAMPCPDRHPLKGYKCNNIELSYAENLKMTNIETDSGSKGISIRFSDNAELDHVVAKNVRGPYPAGQCFQIHTSHGTTMSNFTCHNDPSVAWTEDSISVYHSADVTLKHGNVYGGNSKTGQSVMFEGSSFESIGGHVEDVEVVNAQGCFGYFPQKGIFQTGGVCASPVCLSDDPPRGAQPMTNLWTAGANINIVEGGIFAEDIWVEDSHFYDGCDESESRIGWEYNDGMYTHFDVTELEEFTPRTPASANLPWDAECWKPTYTCADFLQEDIGARAVQEKRISTQNADKSTYESLQGACYGNVEWNDGQQVWLQD